MKGEAQHLSFLQERARRIWCGTRPRRAYDDGAAQGGEGKISSYITPKNRKGTRCEKKTCELKNPNLQKSRRAEDQHQGGTREGPTERRCRIKNASTKGEETARLGRELSFPSYII